MTDVKEKKSRSLIGIITSDRMQDTVTVTIERRVKHPKYGKYIKRKTKLHAHDKGNQAKMGDTVIIKECKPISKTKSWMVDSIKERARI